MFSADCWPSECEERERPGRASDGSLSIILTLFVARMHLDRRWDGEGIALIRIHLIQSN